MRVSIVVLAIVALLAVGATAQESQSPQAQQRCEHGLANTPMHWNRFGSQCLLVLRLCFFLIPNITLSSNPFPSLAPFFD